jgi:hypothetical protein
MKALVPGRPRARWRGALLALLAPFAAAPAAAAQTPPTLLVGAFVESNYSTQPGLQVAYASPAWRGGRPRLTASYSTTRIATAMGSNALTEDRVQLGAGWYFRPDRALTPYLAANVGYTRFDREDPELFALLDAGAPLASLLLGVEGRLHPAVRASGHVGFSPVQSSTVYPFVAAIGMHYRLSRGGGR